MAFQRSEALVRLAPRSVPRVASYDYAHRCPVLTISTGATFFHLDLEELTAEEADATLARLRSALAVFGEQLADWQKRATADRTGAYPIPPVPYGVPGEDHAGGGSGDGPGGSGGGSGAGPGSGGGAS